MWRRCGGSERGRTKWYRKTTNREKPLEGYLPLQISTWPQGRQPNSITVNGWLHSTRLLSRHTFSLLRNWFHILWSPVSQSVSCGWQRHLSRAKVLPRNFHPNRASSKNIVNLCTYITCTSTSPYFFATFYIKKKLQPNSPRACVCLVRARIRIPIRT